MASDQLKLTYYLHDSGGLYKAELFEAKSRKLTRRRNITATAEVVVDMESTYASLMDPALAPRLKVYRDTTAAERAATPGVFKKLVFHGLLPPENVRDDTDTGMRTCLFADPRWRLANNYLIAPLTYTGLGQGSIINGLWQSVDSRPGGKTYMTIGSTDNLTLRDRTYPVGTNIAQAIQDMSQLLNGCDTDCDPYDALVQYIGAFSSYAYQGIDRPLARFVHGFEDASNCDVLHYYMPALTYATEAGIDDAGNQLVVGSTATTPSTSPYFLQESYITEGTAFTSATLLSKANQIVTSRFTPQDVFEVKNITQEAPQPMLEYDLGDRVRMAVSRGVLQINDATIRVDGYDLVVQDNGAVMTQALILVTP